MKSVSFYHRETGRIHSCKLIASDDLAVVLNTPDDHLVIEGHHDEAVFKVDTATGALVPHGEAAPAADPRPRILQAIAEIEARQGRAIREAALGMPGAPERLRGLDSEIAALRNALA